LRVALIYYDGNSEFGQFYLNHDEHVGSGCILIPEIKGRFLRWLLPALSVIVLFPRGAKSQEDHLLFLPSDAVFDHLIGDPGNPKTTSRRSWIMTGLTDPLPPP